MKNDDTIGDSIRQQAESILAAREALDSNWEHLSVDAIRAMVHEFRVHQIELEMQNEELRRTQVALDVSRAEYVDLYDKAPAGYCTLSAGELILRTNLATAEMFGLPRGEVHNKPISRFICKEDQETYYRLRHRAMADDATQSCDLRIVRNDGTQLLVRLSFAVDQSTGNSPSHRLILVDISDRIAAEYELRKSREFVRATMDSLAAQVCVLDAQGNVLAVNRAWLKFGEVNGAVPGTVFEGLNYLSLCEQAVGNLSNIAIAFAEGIRAVSTGLRESFELEYPCHSPHEQRWFVGRVVPFAGGVDGAVVVSHENVTQRCKAEEAMRASEALFSTIFHASPVAIALTRVAGMQLMDVNPAWVKLTGYSRQEAIGRKSTDLNLWVHSAERDALIREVLQSGTTQGRETELRDKAGCVHTLLKSVELIRVAEEPVLLTLDLNITERKSLEREVKQNAEKAHAIIAASPVPMATNETHQNITFLNPAFVQAFGYSREDIPTLADWWSRAYPDADYRDWVVASWHAELAHSRQSGLPFSPMEVRIYCKNGTVKTALVNATPLSEAFQEEHLILLYDITDRKEAEEALAQVQEQLRQSQKLEAVGQLAGGVAHDFRNQLTIIAGFVELLEQPTQRGDRAALFQEIRKAVERSSTLCGHLLSFSRQQVLSPEPADIGRIVAELGTVLPHLLGEDIQVVILPPSSDCIAIVDAGHLHQSILNLATNARDAMPTGGTLTIGAVAVDAGDAILLNRPEATLPAYVSVYVRDTGVGMDESTLARIFEPFFTTKPVGQGTGLGLPMVYGFIKQTGGFISVESRPGQGTEFRLFMPRIATSAMSESIAANVPRVVEPATGTVLVVEDEAALRRLFVNSLSNLGFTVHSAANPADALELLRQTGTMLNLLITDLVMPGGSGLDLAATVRALQPRTAVLYISGYVGKDLSSRGLTEVPGAFLLKPFSLKQLDERVRELVEHQMRPDGT